MMTKKLFLDILYVPCLGNVLKARLTRHFVRELPAKRPLNLVY